MDTTETRVTRKYAFRGQPVTVVTRTILEDGTPLSYDGSIDGWGSQVLRVVLTDETRQEFALTRRTMEFHSTEIAKVVTR